MADPSSGEFFDQVRDGVLASLLPAYPVVGGYAHGYGTKITVGSGERTREHYEAQVIRGRIKGAIELEIGFHAEHPNAQRNDDVLALLSPHEKKWRKALGGDVIAGPFLGNDKWRRVSETWTEFDFRDPELVFEVADRLAQYVETFEPLLGR